MTLISPLLSTTDMVYAQLAKKLPTTKSSHSLQLLVRERGLGMFHPCLVPWHVI